MANDPLIIIAAAVAMLSLFGLVFIGRGSPGKTGS